MFIVRRQTQQRAGDITPLYDVCVTQRPGPDGLITITVLLFRLHCVARIRHTRTAYTASACLERPGPTATKSRHKNSHVLNILKNLLQLHFNTLYWLMCTVASQCRIWCNGGTVLHENYLSYIGMTRNNTVNLQRQPRKVAVRLFVTNGPAFSSTALTVPVFSASPERRWFSRIHQVAPMCTSYSESQKWLLWQRPPAPLDPHLTHDSYGPSEPTTQTASRSVQPFL